MKTRVVEIELNVITPLLIFHSEVKNKSQQNIKKKNLVRIYYTINGV